MLSYSLKYLSYLITLALMLSVFIGAIRFKKLSNPFRILTAYMLFALFSDLLFRRIGNSGFNLYAIPIYAILELMILTYWFYHFLLEKNKVVLYIGAIVGASIIIDLLFISELFHAKNYRSYGKVLADIGVILYLFLYYAKSLKGKLPSTELLQIINAMLAYFSINLLTFSSINFLVNAAPTIVSFFWLIHLLISIFFYSFIAYRLWHHGKTQKPLPLG